MIYNCSSTNCCGSLLSASYRWNFILYLKYWPSGLYPSHILHLLFTQKSGLSAYIVQVLYSRNLFFFLHVFLRCETSKPLNFIDFFLKHCHILNLKKKKITKKFYDRDLVYLITLYFQMKIEHCVSDDQNCCCCYFSWLYFFYPFIMHFGAIWKVTIHPSGITIFEPIN